MIDYRQYELSNKEARGYYLTTYVGLFLVLYLFYQSVVVSLVGGLLCLLGKKHYAAFLAEKRRHLLNGQFRDLLYSLSASFAAGRQMNESLEEALPDLLLLYDEDAPIVMELTHMIRRRKESKESEEQLLADFARRSCSEDIQSFADVYFTCRTTGGDVEKVIANTSAILTDKITIEREIKTLTAQKRFEGKLISAMPLAVILLLNLLSPEYLAVMYNTFEGRAVMSAGLLGIGSAYYLTVKYTSIEV